ncbi:MAG: hypothetical protein ACLRWQ_18550 [Flavonifractor plautii]
MAPGPATPGWCLMTAPSSVKAGTSGAARSTSPLTWPMLWANTWIGPAMTACSSRGAQVLVETARFGQPLLSRPEAGKVNLLFCKGPDEYCGITSNNLFTNAMVKHNLSLALTAAAR